tara:strand:- start:10 stop:558 length:549 start_codon:yes stop_codon:yes gene_type:complete
MRLLIVLILLSFLTNLSLAKDTDEYFFIGKMESYNKNFVLYFKARKKPILARGEYFNYITDYPQDLYIYDNSTKIDSPLISYEWFPKKAKKILNNYNFPVFPEDFAYYLLSDNNTLIMVSAIKNVNNNLQFNIKKKELKLYDGAGKLNFIISTYAEHCGYKNLKEKYQCNLFKPLISNNLIN